MLGERKKPCILCKDSISLKRSTIVWLRKNAKEIKEDREITKAKIKAVRSHDLSTGIVVRCETEEANHFFAIRKY